jgi:hypothetical protein
MESATQAFRSSGALLLGLSLLAAIMANACENLDPSTVLRKVAMTLALPTLLHFHGNTPYCFEGRVYTSAFTTRDAWRLYGLGLREVGGESEGILAGDTPLAFLAGLG